MCPKIYTLFFLEMLFLEKKRMSNTHAHQKYKKEDKVKSKMSTLWTSSLASWGLENLKEVSTSTQPVDTHQKLKPGSFYVPDIMWVSGD
jgi:hypothetical protein